jgi:hypothetical protein
VSGSRSAQGAAGASTAALRVALGFALACACACQGRQIKDYSTRFDSTTEGGGEIYGTEVGPGVTPQSLAKEQLVDDRPGTAEEVEVLAGLKKRAEKLRGLPFIREVALRVQSKKGMTDYIRKKALEHFAPSYQRYRALGMLDPKMSLQKLIDEGTKDVDLQGYYEPDGQYLVLRADVVYGLTAVARRRENVEWRSVIIHELVHALQDQHFGIRVIGGRTTDEQHAYMAVVEGDATLSQLEYIVGRLGLEFAPLIADHYKLDRLVNGLPPVGGVGALVTPLAAQPGEFRYRAGVLFAAAMFREGGKRLRDTAFRRPPKSASDVQDPLSYLNRERRTYARLPSLSTLTNAGYLIAQQDTLGRIELAVYLMVGGLGGDIIANAWKADRLAVVTRGEELGSVWLIKVTSAEEGADVVARANDGVGAVTKVEKGTFLADQVGDVVYLIRGIEERLHAPLKRELTAWIQSGKAVKVAN